VLRDEQNSRPCLRVGLGRCGRGGYAWVTQPDAAEFGALRDRAGLSEIIAQRMATMTAAERRQFDALMKWHSPRQ
jgi:beta-glucosidase-like glycosyl hydrolase